MDVLYLTEAIGDEEARASALNDLFGNNVVVFRLKTRRLDVTAYTHADSFSIKTVFSGIERYHFEEREVGVAPGDVLMVSPGRTYGSSIRSSEVTDSFSIFLPQRWVEEKRDAQINSSAPG